MLPTEDLFVYVYVLVDDLVADRIIAIPPRPGPAPARRDAELLSRHERQPETRYRPPPWRPGSDGGQRARCPATRAPGQPPSKRVRLMGSGAVGVTKPLDWRPATPILQPSDYLVPDPAVRQRTGWAWGWGSWH